MTTFRLNRAKLARMKTLIVLSFTLVTAAVAPACGGYDSSLLDCSGRISLTLDQLTRDAVSADEARADSAMRALRARGPGGLRALLEANAALLKQRATANPFPASCETDGSWLRLRAALDGVSGQRDCSASQLYWYTDFEQAKVAAKAEAKPILSLRLLGQLDEEFSCANSRFFRTTLYANAEVSQYLRDHFILHWKSVRPVPRVTIDFGDGRVLERTITGNSIHYVLNENGDVVDALPGLYGAKAFVRGLQRAGAIAQQSSKAPVAEQKAMLASYHRARIAALDAELEQDLQRITATIALSDPQAPRAVSFALLTTPSAQAAALVADSKGRVELPILDRTISKPVTGPPTANAAAAVAVGKRAVEAPILDRTAPTTSPTRNRAGADMDDAAWQKIAALHAEDAALDQAAKNLIRAKGPNAIEASRVARSKSIVEDPMLRKLRSMERSISEDTVRNEYLLHRQIHEWLAGNTAPRQIDTLNAKVYAELFLTPDSDPWLGLLPADAYAALENDGFTITAKH